MGLAIGVIDVGLLILVLFVFSVLPALLLGEQISREHEHNVPDRKPGWLVEDIKAAWKRWRAKK
jgi:hypothetical protein